LKIYALVVLLDNQIIDWKISSKNDPDGLFDLSEYQYIPHISLRTVSKEGTVFEDFEPFFKQWRIHEEHFGITPYAERKIEGINIDYI